METHPRLRKQPAFTRIELLAILVVLALFIFLLIPALIRAKQRQVQTQCMDNLRLVGTAYRLWGDDANNGYPMERSNTNGGSLEYILSGHLGPHYRVLSNELGGRLSLLTCPADTRIAASNFTSLQNSNISYFLGGDADESNPRLFMAGDRNWETNGVALPAGLAFLLSNAPVAWAPKTIHRGSGNVVLSDGSVQKLSSSQLRAALLSNGNSRASNMLVFP
jgi:competence protein ComGC